MPRGKVKNSRAERLLGREKDFSEKGGIDEGEWPAVNHPRPLRI